MKKFFGVLASFLLIINLSGLGALSSILATKKVVSAQGQTNQIDEKQQFLNRRDAEILSRPNIQSDSKNKSLQNKFQQPALQQRGVSNSQISSPATASVLLTNGDKSKLLSTEPSIEFSTNQPLASDELAIRVEPTKTYQTMDGFGAALTDSSAWLISNKLTETQRNTLLDNLFTPNGANINIVRLPMGASDFALSSYTYNDLPNVNDADLPQNNFSAGHDLGYIIPTLKKAQSRNSTMKVIAVPWSAPGWMKENYINSSYPLLRGNLKPGMHDSYGTYFKKFVNSYLYAGVGVHYVAPQNEPLHTNGWLPSMGMTAAEQASFIKNNLKPALNSTFMNPGILTYDHNWDRTDYPLTVLADADAKSKTAGTAFHCYGGEVTKQLLVEAAHPDKGIYFTECTGSANSNINFGPDFRWGMHNIMIGSVRNFAKSVQYWNIALDENNGPYLPGGCTGCRGLVTIDSTTGNVTYNTEYYLLAHFGKNVKAGAQRIESSTFGEGSVESVAFKNPDGSRVLIAANTGSDTKNFSIREGSQSFKYTLAPNSAATFSWINPVNWARDVSTGRIEAEDNSQVVGQAGNEFIGDEGKLDVGVNMTNDTALKFSSLNFDSSSTKFQLRYKTNPVITSGNVEFRIDSQTGPLLASVPVTNQANFYTSDVAFEPSSTITPGTHDIYMVLKNAGTSGVTYPINVNWFKYASNTRSTSPMSNANFKAYASRAPGADVPANALDTDSNTRWTTASAQTLGHTFMVDFTQPTALTGGLIYSAGGDHLRQYKVETSDDGINFITVKNNGNATGVLYDISPSKPIITRYLKITATNQSSIGSWWSIGSMSFINN